MWENRCHRCAGCLHAWDGHRYPLLLLRYGTHSRGTGKRTLLAGYAGRARASDQPRSLVLGEKHSPQNWSEAGGTDCCKEERRQGHIPLISTSSDQLKKVRTSTMSPNTPTVRNVGSMATVRTMSAATSSSSPIRIAFPTAWRRAW